MKRPTLSAAGDRSTALAQAQFGGRLGLSSPAQMDMGRPASDDVSTDDSGALGAIIFGPPVLLLIIVLLGLGVARGATLRAHATDRAE
ncbi:hypothetical protein GCM10023191_005310 [Actinoallomurus oryzae]|uniref:Uncharacterized protein n=1 Tax=Actinoallomurus oryzae TaxID=502180 RepID=A0ABP8P863_9ACTN